MGKKKVRIRNEIFEKEMGLGGERYMYLGDVSIRDFNVHIFQLPEVFRVCLMESSIIVTNGGFLVQKIEYRPLGFP